MAIRPPKSNSQGYTLLEMLAVLGMMAILATIAVPSFLSMNKPLRNGTSQFVNQLSFLRSKAISSNRAYRLRPKYATASEYIGTNPQSGYNNIPRNFIVEYADNCRVQAASSWRAASELDLNLPQEVGLENTAALSWNICFDTRGMVQQPIQISLKDFQGNSNTKTAVIDVSGIGQLDITTRNEIGSATNSAEGRAVY